MPKLHHAVAFGLIVGEGNRRIVKEAQRVLFARCETQEEIMIWQDHNGLGEVVSVVIALDDGPELGEHLDRVEVRQPMRDLLLRLWQAETESRVTGPEGDRQSRNRGGWAMGAT